MSDGIVIDWLEGNCPVQAEGSIDGEPFYFRARGDSWSMSIGGPVAEEGDDLAVRGRDVIGEPAWHHREEYGEWPAAGWMSEDEARGFIAKAADLWRAR